MRKKYFKDSGVPPLRVGVQRRVRFAECDPMGVMWHGHYAGFLEDAREAMGAAYGISYTDFYSRNLILPIKIMQLDYLQPLYYKRVYTVYSILHWTEAARINTEYEIYDSDNKLATRGYTVQLLLNADGELLLELPEFYAAFCEKWKAGALPPVQKVGAECAF